MARDSEGRLTTMASLASGRGPTIDRRQGLRSGWESGHRGRRLLLGRRADFPGSGAGQFGESGTLHLEPGISSLSGSDVDGDGDADLTVANFLSGQVSVLAASGGGTFANARTIGQRSRHESHPEPRREWRWNSPTFSLLTPPGRAAGCSTDDAGGDFEDAGSVPMQLALPDDLHSDVSTAGDTFTLRVVSGNGQAARAGSVLPEAVVFEATRA